MSLLFACDPGGTNGWATFVITADNDTCKVTNFRLMNFGQLPTKHDNAEEFFAYLAQLKAETYVVEDYIIKPPKAGGFDHSFNKGWTLRMIGALMYASFLNDAEFVLQQSGIKTPANAMLTGTPYKKKANMHHWDAILHGVYYAITVLKVPRDCITMG